MQDRKLMSQSVFILDKVYLFSYRWFLKHLQTLEEEIVPICSNGTAELTKVFSIVEKLWLLHSDQNVVFRSFYPCLTVQ